MTAFATPRLTVRRWEPVLDDPGQRGTLEIRLTEILTPAVLEHLPPGFGPGDGPDAMETWCATRRARAQVSLVESGTELIGLLFLFRLEPAQQRALHIGYLLAEEAWGRGLATELVKGLLRHLGKDAPQTLRASVAKANPASACVLTRCGFTPDTDQPEADMQHFHLRLTTG